MYKGEELDVKSIFLSKGFSEVMLVQCPIFPDAYQVNVVGYSWTIQESMLKSNQDAELNDPKNKTKTDQIKTKYSTMINELKHKEKELSLR